MEENSEGLASPPYPGLATTSQSLYRHLIVLREWLIEQQDAIQPLLEALVAAADGLGELKPVKWARRCLESLKVPENLPAMTVWEGVGVTDKYASLMYVRGIREAFDGILRDHEDAWDGKLALKLRANLITATQHILQEAFISPEVREMREVRAQSAYAAQTKAIRKSLQQIAKSQLQSEDEENEGFDWQNPIEEEDEDD